LIQSGLAIPVQPVEIIENRIEAVIPAHDLDRIANQSFSRLIADLTEGIPGHSVLSVDVSTCSITAIDGDASNYRPIKE
jgi:hypothetical protein